VEEKSWGDFPADQSVFQRAWQNTKDSRGTIWFDLGVGVILVTLFSLWGASLTPPNSNNFVSTLYPTVGGITGLIVGFVLIFVTSLLLAFKRQRDESRTQRDKALVHIKKLLDEYIWALSFEGVGKFPYAGKTYVSLQFSNTIDQVIEYEIDMTNTYIELDGKKIPLPNKYPNTGGIISKAKPLSFTVPYPYTQLLQADKVLLHYELNYGRPSQPLRRQMRELDLNLAYSPDTNGISVASTELKRAERSI
jgi:hypothetical protein